MSKEILVSNEATLYHVKLRLDKLKITGIAEMDERISKLKDDVEDARVLGFHSRKEAK